MKAYQKLSTQKRETDDYIALLMGYSRSPIRDIEGYFRIAVGLNEGDNHLILKQDNSDFSTYEIPRGNYSVKDISEVVDTIGNHKKTLQIYYDDKPMKRNSFHSYGGTFGTLRFDEKSFFIK